MSLASILVAPWKLVTAGCCPQPGSVPLRPGRCLAGGVQGRRAQTHCPPVSAAVLRTLCVHHPGGEGAEGRGSGRAFEGPVWEEGALKGVGP